MSKEFDLKEKPVVETKQCKVCNEYKIRVLDGKFNKKDKRWRDGDGRMWNGLVCPPCHSRRSADRLAKKREEVLDAKDY